jgi:spore coat protein U-like protein
MCKISKPAACLAGLLGVLTAPLALALVSVSISPTGGFSITPGIAVVNQSVATITLDADQNYAVTLRDDTNGVLANGADSLPYTVKYNGGGEITLSTSTTSVETGASVTAGNRTLTVFIGAAASIGLPAGAYSATITVEILGV